LWWACLNILSFFQFFWALWGTGSWVGDHLHAQMMCTATGLMMDLLWHVYPHSIAYKFSLDQYIWAQFITLHPISHAHTLCTAMGLASVFDTSPSIRIHFSSGFLQWVHPKVLSISYYCGHSWFRVYQGVEPNAMHKSESGNWIETVLLMNLSQEQFIKLSSLLLWTLVTVDPVHPIQTTGGDCYKSSGLTTYYQTCVHHLVTSQPVPWL
jgi:hypothetical protein